MIEEITMPKMIPIKNNGKMPMYIGSTMIPAGETQIFPEHHVPEHLRPGEEEAEPDQVENPLKALLENSIKEVSEALPGLSADQLDELELLELQGDDRAGLAKAFQAERLRRADLDLDESEGADVTE